MCTFCPQSQENYLVASVVQTLPNPLIGQTSDPNIGRLGFTLQDAINELTILQDFRSKSVLSGLSALGGLGSLLSTMLAMLLGTTLGRAISRKSTLLLWSSHLTPLFQVQSQTAHSDFCITSNAFKSTWSKSVTKSIPHSERRSVGSRKNEESLRIYSRRSSTLIRSEMGARK